MLNYPNEHSYYNIMAGKNVVERYELDYWDISVKQALDTILKQENTKNIIHIGALNNPTRWGVSDQLAYFPSDKKESFYIDEDWNNSAYVIVNTTYAIMYSRNEYYFIRDNYEFVKEFTSYNNVICEVWRKRNK